MRTASNFYDEVAVDSAWVVGRDWDSDPIGLERGSAQSLPSTHCQIHWDHGLLHDGDFLSVGLVVGVQRRTSLRTSFAYCGGGMSSSSSKV
jgi:hypothetical protein